MKKIYFPIFSKATQSKRFSLFDENPGIGGTQFIAIKLALIIANKCPEWKIVLVNFTKIALCEYPSNLSQEIYEETDSFFEVLASRKKCEASIAIAALPTLSTVSTEILDKVNSSIIVWSHHPFDIPASKLVSKFKFSGCVCVGTYQFYSNRNLPTQVHHIQNIFSFPKSSDTKFLDRILSEKAFNIVYLGALVPGKGFLELAKSWCQLKAYFPDIKLNVIGSAATYGEVPDVQEVPTSADFAKEILKYIPMEDIRAGQVIFHGNLGEEKFDVIRKCDLAVLNPTGFTEAFPASPLECMACGVPVVASNDYGMSDCMRFFPELVVKGHKDIAGKVCWLVSDPLRYRELQQRSLSVACWFDSQTDQIITRWVRLINSILEEEAKDPCLLPVMPFCGSKASLYFRRDIKPLLSSLKTKIKRFWPS